MANVECFSCPFCRFSTLLETTIVQHVEISHPEFPHPPSEIKYTYDSMPTDNKMNLKHSARSNEAGCVKIPGTSKMDSHISIMPQKKYFADSSRDLQIRKKAGAESSQPKTLPYKKNPHKEDRILSKKNNLTGRNLSSWSAQNKNHSSSEMNSMLEKPMPSKAKRLGKSELGPHVFEAKMPERLVKLLRDEDGATKIVKKIVNGTLREIEICQNMMPGIIPLIEQLISSDKSTQYVYLCDPSVKHVSRLKKEGGFCGYRNIQMMTSYIISTKSQGYEAFRDKIPSIFDIQENIEMAWDMGINSHGRIETNGIRGTRKYIGTPEAYAMFCSLGIAQVKYQLRQICKLTLSRCDVEAIVTSKIQNKLAYESLFSKVEEYFSKYSTDTESKIRCTNLPPIYLQHSGSDRKGHSMTIVGFERKKNDKRHLIVFDPKYHDLSKITKFMDSDSFSEIPSEDLLKPYRIDKNYLRRYNEFELLKLSSLRNRMLKRLSP